MVAYTTMFVYLLLSKLTATVQQRSASYWC